MAQRYPDSGSDDWQAPRNSESSQVVNDKGMKRTDLILIGKTGHGKSSTGNTILGSEVFESSSNATSETFENQHYTVTRKGRKITVVDTPGLAETRLDQGEAALKVVEDMKKGIEFCSRGYNALILVLRFGNRFTDEEYKAVKLLKAVLGPNSVRDFTIIVFTHGDSFQKQNEKNRKYDSFMDWCMKQTGSLQSLLQECNYRAVLFDNFKEGDEQVDDFFALIDSFDGKYYTNAEFKLFAKEREEMLVRENAAILRKQIQVKIDVLSERANYIKTKEVLNTGLDRDMGDFCKDGDALIEDIVNQDKGTGVLTDLCDKICNLQKEVQLHRSELEKEMLRKTSEEEKKIIQKQADDEIEKVKQSKESEERKLKMIFDLMKMHSEQMNARTELLVKELGKQQEMFIQKMDDMQKRNDKKLEEYSKIREWDKKELLDQAKEQREKLEKEIEEQKEEAEKQREKMEKEIEEQKEEAEKQRKRLQKEKEKREEDGCLLM